MRMQDLFAAPVLPGLEMAENFVSDSEEKALIAAIEAAGLSPFRFQGWLGKRLTHSFGWHYDFETGRFAPAAPIPDWLGPIRDRAAAFARLDADALVQALVIRYDIGAGIDWHRDRPHFEHVVGISLGHAAAMRFRRRVGDHFERASAARPAQRLSSERRGAPRLGAQHRRADCAALVDHLSQSVRQGPAAGQV